MGPSRVAGSPTSPGTRSRCNEPLCPAPAAHSSPASGTYFLRVSHRIAEPTVRGRPMTMATHRAAVNARPRPNSQTAGSAGVQAGIACHTHTVGTTVKAAKARVNANHTTRARFRLMPGGGLLTASCATRQPRSSSTTRPPMNPGRIQIRKLLRRSTNRPSTRPQHRIHKNGNDHQPHSPPASDPHDPSSRSHYRFEGTEVLEPSSSWRATVRRRHQRTTRVATSTLTTTLT